MKTINGNAGAENRDLWIGVSDIGTEDEFTYLSDESLVNWVFEGSTGGRAGKTKCSTCFFYKFARICEDDKKMTLFSKYF